MSHGNGIGIGGGNGNGNGIAGGNGNGNGIVAEIGDGAGPAPCGAVLVCGGGIAGIQASLDLSAAGFRVYLVEESPTIGGSMARLDKTFPTGDCATCIISPKLVECMRDHNIDVLTMADVVDAGGRGGPLQGRDPASGRGACDAEKCTGCGDCWTPARSAIRPETPPPFQPSEPLGRRRRRRLDEILARHEGDPGGVMPVLQEINQAYGYLPRLVLEHLACRWQMRLAEILRVASFYDRFHLEPVGRHVVEVCAGTSCHSPRLAGLAGAAGKGVRRRAGPDRPVGALHAPHGPLPGPVRPVAGHEDRRPELRPRDLDRVPEILEQFA